MRECFLYPTNGVMIKRKRMTILIVACAVLLLAAGVLLFLNQPSFGRLPSGERLERVKRSPNFINDAFRNQSPTELMTGKQNRFVALWNFVFGKKEPVRPEGEVKAVKTDLKRLPKDENVLIWFGHSSYLIQADGKRLLIDPVFETAAPVSFVNKAFKGTEIYKADDMPAIDYLVISHDHWDHLDYKTVKALKNKVGKVVCPLGVGEHFEYWGYDKDRLIELDWEEAAVPEKGLTIHCLPARHFSGRGLKANQSLWASFLIECPTLTIFIGGDGGYGKHFAKTGELFQNIDWAILENGQYSENWKYIHTLPPQLKRIAEDLKPKNILTVHHSKYALSDHRWDEPLRNAEHLKEETQVHVAIPVIGEKVPLSASR